MATRKRHLERPDAPENAVMPRARTSDGPQWIFNRVAAAVGMLALAPVYAAIAAAVVLESGTPVLFRQPRIGRNGRQFRLLKFRSMKIGVPGARITASGDARITRVGAFLRRYKLDELPQLWNVLRSDMDLVGPRPEVPAFVDSSSPTWRAILSARPGITDPASLAHRDEEALLAGAADPERYYAESILPVKLRMNIEYLRVRSFWLDLKLILLTIRYCFLPGTGDPAAAVRSLCLRVSHD
jgi:lipopolysaccharide/colanic/teichoic acid biosynthesis glycosyltransferase